MKEAAVNGAKKNGYVQLFGETPLACRQTL
jgi:hypothetical protein